MGKDSLQKLTKLIWDEQNIKGFPENTITGKRIALFLIVYRYRGALYGRIIGLVLVFFFLVFKLMNMEYGLIQVFAAIGAASFFSSFKISHPPHFDNGEYVEFSSIFVAKVELSFCYCS